MRGKHKTIRFFSLLLGLSLAGGAALTFAAAQEPQSRLAAIKDELAAADQEIATLKARQQAADKDSASLSSKLVALAGEVQAVEQRSNKIDSLLTELNHRIADKEDVLNEQDSDKQATIAALTRLTRHPDTLELNDSSPLIDRVRAAAIMRAVVPSIENQAAQIAQELSALTREKTVQEDARQKLTTSHAVLDDKRAKLAGLIDEKKSSQAALAKSLEKTTAKVSALRHEAHDLEDLLRKIEQTKQQKAAARANRPHLRSLQAGGQASGPRPHLLSMRLTPTQAPASTGGTDNVTREALSYSGAFAALKGQFPPPPRGPLTRGYGARHCRAAAPPVGSRLAASPSAHNTPSPPPHSVPPPLPPCARADFPGHQLAHGPELPRQSVLR